MQQRRCAQSLRILAALSVSTSGSKGVQRSRALRCSSALSPFSIHKRIEGGATRIDRDDAENSQELSVSTSGSKGVQRMGRSVFVSWERHFQYPQADRRGCNLDSANFADVKHAFQYPQADRRGCNQCHTLSGLKRAALSVSTSGSKGVQQQHPR